MTTRTIHVQAASRLHFGLFAFGREGTRERNFGGVGMMIEQPSLSLSITPAKSFSTSGPLAQRAKKFAARWVEFSDVNPPPACEIKVHRAPPEHFGFGVGTQLGVSVAAGLNALFGESHYDAEQLAQATGRGARSAVGVYGFIHGGLIVEDGKLDHESLSPLLHHCDVPSDWRVVLLRPQQAQGLSGVTEQKAFSELPPVASNTSARLRSEVSQRMLPAIQSADFDAFSRSVTSYGELAGGCFAAAQGGPYNGPVLHDIVRTVRTLGIEGVGQSSWGPTIYCFLPNLSAAESFAEQAKPKLPEVDITITKPCNHGARIESQTSANPAAAKLSCTLSRNP